MLNLMTDVIYSVMIIWIRFFFLFVLLNQRQSSPTVHIWTVVCKWPRYLDTPAPRPHLLRCVEKLSLQHRHSTRPKQESMKSGLLGIILSLALTAYCVPSVPTVAQVTVQDERFAEVRTISFYLAMLKYARVFFNMFQNWWFHAYWLNSLSGCLFLELLEEFLQPNSGEGPRKQAWEQPAE